MNDRIRSRRTPYDDNYETCLETRTVFTVYPKRISPDELTRRLGLEPSSTQRAGEARTNSLGRQRVVPVNGWFLSSEGHVTSNDLRRHLDWLLAKLQPVNAAISALQNEVDVSMSVNCIWWSRGSGGPTLWPEQMLALANLDLECAFDIYFVDEDPRE
ncbi:DUF4279 domain-containing protein [Pendulispora rubella]|uniref:DUF4279 domain-containing protein n=1 Tax=Pendulispora rubella TaxID=2741070 RepID=A0ABZ2L0F3_9BACT